ncbi:MAG TPA: hypothetical protein DD490_20075, partial [Acidobacteria bacterium]|nr:hypothetical protein [Acidobacteriota bacterium]
MSQSFRCVVFGLSFLLPACGSQARAQAVADFPPLPPPAELTAQNEAERQAGAVILESVMELSGHVTPTGNDPWTLKHRRMRYLVLDARGGEQLREHSFFGTSGSQGTLSKIQGRTVTAQGEVIPLDPGRDVRSLDVKGPGGKESAQTVFFPHVEPGAVLDLQWSETSQEVPAFLVVPLQEILPIRRLSLRSQGLLMKMSTGMALILSGPQYSYFWVPFFLGPIPQRAHARIDGEFNLQLEVRDLAPAPDEPWSPARVRTNPVLGLLPRPLGITDRRNARDWHKNLILFGPQGAPPEDVETRIIERDLDPGQAVVRLDELALQPLPDWPADDPLMASHQAFLGLVDFRFDDFLRRSSRAMDAASLARMAPPDLPWQERARRLYDYVRSRLKPDPGAELAKDLNDLLKGGRAAETDVVLYTRFLLEKAGIPARPLLALSSRATPFQPFLPLAAFRPQLLLEVGPAGETIYLSPGDRYATFGTSPEDLAGGLAFRQPAKGKKEWTLARLPADLPVAGATRIEASSRLDPEGKPTDLTLAATLKDNAARDFRWQLGMQKGETLTDAERLRRQETLRQWVDSWVQLPLPGEPPVLNPDEKVREPLSFTLKVPWQPDLQRVGGQILVPALPQTPLFQNVFHAESRETPLWLPGGHVEVALAWELPAGTEPAAVPPRVEKSGPGGLSYTLEVAFQPPALTTRLTLDLPRFLPRTDYPAVRRFFEDLQRAA